MTYSLVLQKLKVSCQSVQKTDGKQAGNYPLANAVSKNCHELACEILNPSRRQQRILQFLAMKLVTIESLRLG